MKSAIAGDYVVLARVGVIMDEVIFTKVASCFSVAFFSIFPMLPAASPNVDYASPALVMFSLARDFLDSDSS